MPPGHLARRRASRFCPGMTSLKRTSACDVPTGTSQACPDMNEAANQGGLGMTGARGGAERCRTTLQHQELATFTTDLYRSRDTCGNFLRLVRPTRPYRGRLVSIQRTRPCELVFGRSPGICGNFPRPAPLACPCFRRHAAIARIAPLDRRRLGRLLVQPQWIGKRPRSELQKEQLPLRRRTHSCACHSTFPDPPVAMYPRGRSGGLTLVDGNGRSWRYRFSPIANLSARRP